MRAFNFLTLFTALIIAGCAAFFSVYGISLLFSGALIATAIMASSIELGKIISVTWLFNYWRVANTMIKTYLVIAIVILMGITSLGIFGYLMAAHQKSALEIELAEHKILTLESQKSSEMLSIDTLTQNINKYLDLRQAQELRLSSMMTNVALTRNPIQYQATQDQISHEIETLNTQIDNENNRLSLLTDKISAIDDDIFDLKMQNLSKKDITTFKFVADELNTDIKHVVKWFILLIIFVFDPLAIVLILAFNISFRQLYRNKKTLTELSDGVLTNIKDNNIIYTDTPEKHSDIIDDDISKEDDVSTNEIKKNQ